MLALILSAQTSLFQLSGPVLNIDQIKRFLSVIMDVLDTSISIPKVDEASEQGEKVSKKVSDSITFHRMIDSATAWLAFIS